MMIEPRPLGPKSDTLPCRCKSWLIQQGCTSVDKLRPTTYFSSILRFVPKFQRTFILKLMCSEPIRWVIHVGPKCNRWKTAQHLGPPGDQTQTAGPKSDTLPCHCKSRLIQECCTSVDKLRSTTETQAVLAKCLMSLNGHLLRPWWDQSSLLLFHKIQCGAVSIEKDKYMTPAHSFKTTRSSHSAQYCRYQTHSDALKNSFLPWFPELFNTGIVCLLLWSIPRPQRSLGHSSFSQKHS